MLFSLPPRFSSEEVTLKETEAHCEVPILEPTDNEHSLALISELQYDTFWQGALGWTLSDLFQH